MLSAPASAQDEIADESAIMTPEEEEVWLGKYFSGRTVVQDEDDEDTDLSMDQQMDSLEKEFEETMRMAAGAAAPAKAAAPAVPAKPAVPDSSGGKSAAAQHAPKPASASAPAKPAVPDSSGGKSGAAQGSAPAASPASKPAAAQQAEEKAGEASSVNDDDAHEGPDNADEGQPDGAAVDAEEEQQENGDVPVRDEDNGVEKGEGVTDEEQQENGDVPVRDEDNGVEKGEGVAEEEQQENGDVPVHDEDNGVEEAAEKEGRLETECCVRRVYSELHAQADPEVVMKLRLAMEGIPEGTKGLEDCRTYFSSKQHYTLQDVLVAQYVLNDGLLMRQGHGTDDEYHVDIAEPLV